MRWGQGQTLQTDEADKKVAELSVGRKSAWLRVGSCPLVLALVCPGCVTLCKSLTASFPHCERRTITLVMETTWP